MLQAQSIDVYYGASKAVSEVSVFAEAGKVTCILGRNGVGKTSVIRAIAGLQPIRGGSVLLQGQNVSGLKSSERARLGIALVPQGREIFSQLTVEENLRTGFACLPRAARRISPKIFSFSLCSKACLTGVVAICPVASSNNWQLPAHWSRSPNCFCWMSQQRAYNPRSSRISSGSSACCVTAAAWRLFWSAVFGICEAAG